MAVALPTGTITFLLTDVEGSTHLWEQHPDAMRQALIRHDAIVELLTEQHHGCVVRPRGEGDSRFCVFARATDAVAAAAAIQRALHAEPWPTPMSIRVHMALHTGEADLREGDYYGTAVNRCARLRAIAHGGQTLVSEATRDLVRAGLPPGASLRDLGEHRLRDLGEAERVCQLVAPGLPTEFPTLQSLGALPNNLPLQVSSFVGRERALAEVRRLLGEHRLVTLTGTGGSGKTRLALQAAADLLDAPFGARSVPDPPAGVSLRSRSGRPDGAWFVDLAPLSDPALVPQVALAAVGGREVPGEPATSTLVAYLRGKSALVLLDNCEHLIDACARLADALVRGCPGLRILATSRELLGLAGEVAWRVPSLELPDPDGAPTPAALARCEAVALFVERARLVEPAFELTEQNAPVLAEVCRQLDGVPLAIELAAARVRVLTVEQIGERLRDRFRLLTGGGRTALPRQRTLRALVDWSHDLLAESEQAAFRRLAVFVGGWTLEAAEAVCGFAPLAGEEVLDLLTSLVDKSLVVAEPSGAEERYRLLETLRQYAQEKLLAAGEQEEVRDRHRDWCLALAERAEPELMGPGQGAWLDRLEVEHDNLRAALAWCRAGAPDRDVGLRLAPPLLMLWFQRGYAREGQAWLEDALARGGAAPAALRSHALNAAGFLAMRQGDLDRAGALVEESIRLDDGASSGRPRMMSPKATLAFVMMGRQQWGQARALLLEEIADALRIGDRRVEATAHGMLGRLENYAGAYAAAQARLEQSIAIGRAEGDPFLVQASLMFLAVAKMAQGDYAGARTAQGETVAILRDLGNREGGPISLTILGQIARLEGEESEARACFSEAVRLFRDLGGERRYLAWTLDGVAGTAAEERRWARAARLFGAAATARPAGGDAVVPVLGDRNEHELARARASLGGSFEAAWSEGQAMTPEQAIAYALSDQD